MDEFNDLAFLHRVYIDARERLIRAERELKEAKDDCLRAGMAHAFAGEDEIEIHNLRQELALREWETACEQTLICKERLYERLRLEIMCRRPGGVGYAPDPAD